jgi:hypothetical protein
MEDEEKPSEVAPPSSEQVMQTGPGVTDWTSENDPDDPHNWPAGKKAYHAGMTAAFAFTTYALSKWPSQFSIMADSITS